MATSSPAIATASREETRITPDSDRTAQPPPGAASPETDSLAAAPFASAAPAPAPSPAPVAPILTRDEIRARLRQQCEPEDVQAWEEIRGVPAAVLIGLVSHPDGPRVILTQRTAHLTNHPGEISFPGGRMEPEDEGPAAAALREALEEIGLPPENVEILGCLPPHRTISKYRVYPVVGWIDRSVEFTMDEHEVAEIFLMPLSFIVDPANLRRGTIMHDGKERGFYVFPYPGHRIWGATAGMLVTLARILNGTQAG